MPSLDLLLLSLDAERWSSGDVAQLPRQVKMSPAAAACCMCYVCMYEAKVRIQYKKVG